MAHTTRSTTDDAQETLPDLAELARLHDVGLDLIEKSDDVHALLDTVIEEYERRLSELPSDALDTRSGPSQGTAKKVRALMMFATQAVALKVKAESAEELKRRARELETAHARLEGVLSAIDAGILIAGSDGRVLASNRAARELTGVEPGSPLPSFLDGVESGEDGEVFRNEGEARRVLTVGRRTLPGSDGEEAILLTDVTARDREKDERHRLEKLGEVLRTLSVLSHKINNPLTALLGRAQLLRMNKNADAQVIKAALVIEESSQRIAELIRELARVVKEGRQEAIEKILDMSEVQDAEGVP
jgi:PAS domain-containing protein